MKLLKTALSIALFLIVSHPGASLAQVFYVFPDANPVEFSKVTIGPYTAVGENETFRAAGFGRIGIAKYMDVGVELLLETETVWGAGFDLKLALLPSSAPVPFDLSASAGLGVIKGDNLSIVQAPVGLVASSPYLLNNGNLLTPFAGFYLLIVNTEIDLAPSPSLSDTDLDVELRGGLRYTVDSQVDLFGALHLGRDALFSLGFLVRL